MKKILLLIFALTTFLLAQNNNPTHDNVRPKAKPISTEWKSPLFNTVDTINLSTKDASPFEIDRIISGGKLSSDGWQATDTLCFIKITLKNGFASDQSGAIEIDMMNLDFKKQVNGTKQHFFSLYADSNGNHFILPNSFLTLRAGRYDDSLGNRGIKVLWKGGYKRGEDAPFAVKEKWDTNKIYTWRAEWTKDELVVFLNGERIFGPAEFNNRINDLPLKYIFISRDFCSNDKIWYGMPGPIYKSIRIYR